MALLTPWESETRLIGVYLATGLLAHEHAQSVLLVSPPGHGKTAMLSRFAELPSAKLVSDLTSNGVRMILQRDETRTLRHFLLPEFERLFSRDRFVSSQTINLLSNLMTGDAGVEVIGRDEYDFSGRQLGLLAAMTNDTFRTRQAVMAETGLLSRFHVLHVGRSKEERDRVIANILRQDRRDLSKIRWPELLAPPRSVTFPASLGEAVHHWLDSTKIPYDERFTGRILVLLRAVALLNRRGVVTEHDVRTLMAFTPFLESRSDIRLTWPVT